MPLSLDSVREALQVALLPKLTAIEKDLQAFRAEVAQSNQELRAEGIENYQGLRAEMNQNTLELRAEIKQNTQDLRAEMKQSNLELRSEIRQNADQLRAELKQSNLELRAELELKFTILVSEIQKIGIRTEVMFEKSKAETETHVFRTIAPLGERLAVLEMSFQDLRKRMKIIP
jgi:hypothetical protein